MSKEKVIIAERLGGKSFGKGQNEYKFAKIKKAKMEAQINHPNTKLIDLGVGEPGFPTDKGIIEVLQNEATKLENHHYSDNGIPAFQEAAVQFLERVYGLKNLNPSTNILHGIGSKPILAMLPLCFINPGDVTLTTTPGYPVLGTYTQYVGGSIYSLPLYKENYFYPDFSSIPEEILKKAKLLYLNYPNNPTGQIPTEEFYKEVVEFAHKHQILVVSDAAYSALVFDGHKPLSFLSIDGAMDVGVEIHSLSKSYNMTGWRLGFTVGNEKLIKAYGTVKDNTDSGQFKAIQRAGIYALQHPEIIEKNCGIYSRRLDMLVKALREVGFDIEKPKSTFYCYVPIPKGTTAGVTFNTAEEVATFLIKEALISTVPWDDAGSYLRFSVTFQADSYEEELEVIEELKQRLLGLGLVF